MAGSRSIFATSPRKLETHFRKRIEMRGKADHRYIQRRSIPPPTNLLCTGKQTTAIFSGDQYRRHSSTFVMVQAILAEFPLVERVINFSRASTTKFVAEARCNKKLGHLQPNAGDGRSGRSISSWRRQGAGGHLRCYPQLQRCLLGSIVWLWFHTRGFRGNLPSE